MSLPMVNKHFKDINPRLLGWYDCEPHHTFGPTRREYYVIHYVCSGKGTLETDYGTFQIGAGQIFFNKPHETIHYYADDIDPWSYIWVGFDGEFCSKLDILENWVYPYPEDTFLKFYHAEDLTNTREEYVAGILHLIFANLLANVQPPLGYARRAADYISANYTQNIKIENLAASLGITRRYLTRVFKEEYGLSVQEFLIRTRLQYAALLLKEGESVSNAALYSGYDDAFNFSKIFKKRYGVSPKHYSKSAFDTNAHKL